MATHSQPKDWQSYEQVAAYLLNRLANELGLEEVEGKQKLPGASGTEWEVDAKGLLEGREAFVVIECRRTRARQSQSKVAALAYSIQDTGGAGGIIVTPIPLQTGAAKVAQAANIQHVLLDINSTPENFAIQFLNKLFIGASAHIGLSARCSCTVTRDCTACGTQFECVSNEQTCPACSGT